VQRTLVLVMAAVVGLALLSRAMTYTVRFTESGVLTTFGSASKENVRNEPGLYFKWPEPIQSVTKYDTRKRFLKTRLESQQTSDNRLVVVEAYCLWRVKDPLQFFKLWSNSGPRETDHYRTAEDALRGTLRVATGEVAKYRMDELFTPGGSGTKLAELEKRVLEVFQQQVQQATQDSIEAIDVGISKIVFPEATTQQVFEQMKQARAKLVKDIESRGASQSKTITDTAEQNVRRITNFANNLAAELRAKGDQEAQQYVAQMNQNPEFAVFLKAIDFLRQFAAKQTTFVLSTDGPGLDVLSPGAIKQFKADGILPGNRGIVSPTPPVAEPASKEGKR
jgi:modulator of FtsH protease HflC